MGGIGRVCITDACVQAHAQSFPTLQPHGLQPTRLLCPWDSPGKNTGVGCQFLLLLDLGIKLAISFVSCIGGQIFYHCAIWEAPYFPIVVN